MGTYYSFGVGMGFEILFSQIVKKYGKYMSELSHMEDRFDPITGKKVEPEKVVDEEAGQYIVVGDERYSVEQAAHEILEALAKDLGCSIVFTNEGPENDIDDSTVLFLSPKNLRFKNPSTDCLEYGRIDASGGFLMADVAKALPKMQALAASLKKKGIRVGKPMVRILGGYG